MDFTIVTASYNYGHYLEECIESVRQQQGVRFEHWIFDAGSTDNTHEILKRHAHLKCVIEPDKGMSEAINKGFRRATGDWVIWLNADDRLTPGALAEVLACAQRVKADVIFGTYHFIAASGHLIRRMKLLPFVPFINTHCGCYVPSTAAFYRRESVIQQGFLLNESFRYCMDYEFYARLGKAGKRFHYLPCTLADFRVHNRNASCVGGVTRGTIENELALAKITMEVEAIRRTYGVTLFRRDHLDHGVDLLLFLAAWGLKGLLKLPYFFSVREPRPPATAVGKQP